MSIAKSYLRARGSIEFIQQWEEVYCAHKDHHPHLLTLTLHTVIPLYERDPIICRQPRVYLSNNLDL